MKLLYYLFFAFFYVCLSLTCETPYTPVPEYPEINRHHKLPPDISKQSPDTDAHPPILHSSDYKAPVPLPAAINTGGAKDSPIILADG